MNPANPFNVRHAATLETVAGIRARLARGEDLNRESCIRYARHLIERIRGERLGRASLGLPALY